MRLFHIILLMIIVITTGNSFNTSKNGDRLKVFVHEGLLMDSGLFRMGFLGWMRKPARQAHLFHAAFPLLKYSLLDHWKLTLNPR